MNCNDASELLERMIFEEVSIDNHLRQHIDTCPSCGQVYSDALKAREIMVMARRFKPVLNDPDRLTDDIMSAINGGPPKTAFVPLFLQRMLAAASIAIFLLFGYEQYGVVKKVTALEMQFSGINSDLRYPDPLRLASTIDINNAGISFTEIKRFLSPGDGTTPLSFSNIQKRLSKKIK